MAEYILLMKLTDHGARNVDQAPARQAQALEVFAELGGELEGFWLTMGEYDYIAVGRVPTDEAALAFALYMAMEGSVRTTTVPAFGMEALRAALGAAMPFHHV